LKAYQGQNPENARENMDKPFSRAAELEEKLKRIAEVNAELSIDSTPTDDINVCDTPVGDTPSEPVVTNVEIRIPAAVVADKPNFHPQRESLPSPQFDNQHKPKNKSR